MSRVLDRFGSMVFDDKVMRAMLSEDAYRSMRNTINRGDPLNQEIAHAVAGAEQEYFLVPRDLYDKRPDLRFTGRTLFGVMPPKGQELDDHYFGAIKPEISRFMEELNDELWKQIKETDNGRG